MTRARAAPRPKPDILIQNASWRTAPNVRTTIRRALDAAAKTVDAQAHEVAVVLTDDAAIHLLNRQWRGFDKATNVLSFPAAMKGHREHLGDIVIAYETMAREAQTEEKTFNDHLAHMVVHGYLHLVGFDHETAREAKLMEQRERDILAALGIADPYAVRPREKTRIKNVTDKIRKKGR